MFRALPALTPAACRLGGTAWLDPQCGEWAAVDGVQLCTRVPPPPPTHLPSVCEINMVFVWVSAASLAFLRHLLSQRKGKQACRSQLRASFLPTFRLIYTVSAVDNAGTWVGRKVCWAEDSVVLNIFIEGKGGV